MKHLIHFTLLLTAWASVIAENQPYLNLTPTSKSITISNSALNTIGKWMDTRGVEFQQADPIQQPSLINFQGNNVVGFLPKSYLSNKFLVGSFAYPNNRMYITSLLSIFTRPGINTTAPFSIVTQSNYTATLQYEYDTKCFGFYWRNRGVQLCDDNLATEVNSTDNVLLVFASIEGKVLSLQIGDELLQRHVDDDFEGVQGSIMLGGSQQIHSPFFGLVHDFKIFSEPLSEFEKYRTAVQLSWNHKMNLGSWSCWQHDDTYSQNIAGVFSYGGGTSIVANSSSYLQVEEIDALVTSSAVPASLCFAHNSVARVEWEYDPELNMHSLNQNWKFRYTTGSAGVGQVKLLVQDLPSISVNGTLAVCYKSSESSHCNITFGASGYEFSLVPRSGYYSFVVVPCRDSVNCSTWAATRPTPIQVPSAGSIEVTESNFVLSQLHSLIALLVLVVSVIGFVAYRLIKRRRSSAYAQVIVLDELN
jgi:hypothetical protein